MGITRKVRRLRVEWRCILSGHVWEPVEFKDADGSIHIWLTCMECGAWRFS